MRFTHSTYILQWPLTSRSVFKDKTAASVVVDLMYKVHTTYPDLLMLCCRLLNQLDPSKVCLHHLIPLRYLTSLSLSLSLHKQDCPPTQPCVKKLTVIKSGVQRKVKQSTGMANKQQKAFNRQLQDCLKELSKITDSLSPT